MPWYINANRCIRHRVYTLTFRFFVCVLLARERMRRQRGWMICTKDDACVRAMEVGEEQEKQRQKEKEEEERVETEGETETKRDFPCCTPVHRSCATLAVKKT